MPASRPKLKALAAAALAVALASCSSGPKTKPELSTLVGKKVALIAVEGEETARRVAEVALVNQLVKSGDFDLLARQEVEKSRAALGVDTTSPVEIARGAGADLALVARVVRFETQERSGYSKEKINDSQLEAETGDGRTERLYKVRALDGDVAMELVFTDVATGEVRRAEAARKETVTVEDRVRRESLPPRLRFLEKLTNEAFAEFFATYR